ncbi:MAG: hypothetical protein K2X32_08995 [Phycisphaerales bacterium]|nr:hypothetical protein [Phycisphaerales bacterium]
MTTDPNISSHASPDQTPADVADIAALLGRDASAMRQLSGPAMDRIAMAARDAAIASRTPSLRLTSHEHRVSVHQFRRITAPMRMAAAVLLVMTAGVLSVAYFTSSSRVAQPGPTVAQFDPTQEADSILSTLALLDSSSTELTALNNDADAASKSIGSDWLTLPENTDTSSL